MNENYKTQFNLLNIPFDESGQLNSQLEPIFPIKDSIYSDLEFSDHIISTQLPEFCKMTFIGNSGAGKSTLIDRLINNTFNQNIKPTDGYEVSTLDYERAHHKYSLNFWDSSGDEKYEQILRAFYKDVSALVLVFDLNNPKSFEDLEFWLNQGKEFICTPCIAFLLGMKADLEKKIDSDLIRDFCSSEKLEYFECSSLTGEGCQDFIGFMIGRVENNRQSKMCLSTEGRVTLGGAFTSKRDFLLSSDMYFAKKNPSIENKPKKETCILI